jgi:positive regulator of sigma E activity
MTDEQPKNQHVADPRSSTVSFVTTEHFTLQGARSATIAESTGRASIFLMSVSGGLVAWGLVASAASLGNAFLAFGLVLLPTLAFIGLVTYERVLQSGVEDLGYARRIARLRAFYFDNAPEVGPYLMSVPPAERLHIQGLRGGFVQGFRTVAGMVAVITAVLTGSEVGLAVVAAFDAPVIAITAAIVGALASLVILMRYQHGFWDREDTGPIGDDSASV